MLPGLLVGLVYPCIRGPPARVGRTAVVKKALHFWWLARLAVLNLCAMLEQRDNRTCYRSDGLAVSEG